MMLVELRRSPQQASPPRSSILRWRRLGTGRGRGRRTQKTRRLQRSQKSVSASSTVKGYRAMVRVGGASVHIHCRVVATRCSLSTRGVSAGDDMALGFCSENMMPGY